VNPIDIETLATVLQVASVVVGVPSLAAVVIGASVVLRGRGAAQSNVRTGTEFGPNPDAILLMLQGMTKAVGALGRVGGALGRLLVRGLAIVGVFGLVLAGACWSTGAGLAEHAAWAPLAAGVLIVLALVPAAVLTLSLRGPFRVLALTLLVVCVLGLHALWGGYGSSSV
jgi:hypothetical protein